MPHSDRKEKRLRKVKKNSRWQQSIYFESILDKFCIMQLQIGLHLDTTAITNQIKYYLTTNRGNFLEMQYGFYGYTLRADLLWLVIERAFAKNSRKAGT